MRIARRIATAWTRHQHATGAIRPESTDIDRIGRVSTPAPQHDEDGAMTPAPTPDDVPPPTTLALVASTFARLALGEARQPIAYRGHGRRGCTAAHRTARTTAHCVWPRAVWIVERDGGGPWASVSYCRGPYCRGDQTSVVLAPDEATARRLVAWIDDLGCGGGCTRRHRLVRLAVPGTATDPARDSAASRTP